PDWPKTAPAPNSAITNKNNNCLFIFNSSSHDDTSDDFDLNPSHPSPEQPRVAGSCTTKIPRLSIELKKHDYLSSLLDSYGTHPKNPVEIASDTAHKIRGWSYLTFLASIG